MYEETTNDSNGGSTVSVRFGKLEKLASGLGMKMEWELVVASIEAFSDVSRAR